MGVGSYWSPWTPYTIASVYPFVDEIIIVNGGFDLSNPKKDEFTVPLKQLKPCVEDLDIKNKIRVIENHVTGDVAVKLEVKQQFEGKNAPGWYDQRGLNISLANQVAVENGADVILKIDSDQVCYENLYRMAGMEPGYILYQYEVCIDADHLCPRQPDSPWNDSVFFYEAKKNQFYGGGGSPDIKAARKFTKEIRCIHARNANPPGLSDEERFQHFYGRRWFSEWTNHGFWGDELKEICEESAKNHLINTTDRLTRLRAPMCVTVGAKEFVERW